MGSEMLHGTTSRIPIGITNLKDHGTISMSHHPGVVPSVSRPSECSGPPTSVGRSHPTSSTHSSTSLHIPTTSTGSHPASCRMTFPLVTLLSGHPTLTALTIPRETFQQVSRQCRKIHWGCLLAGPLHLPFNAVEVTSIEWVWNRQTGIASTLRPHMLGARPPARGAKASLEPLTLGQKEQLARLCHSVLQVPFSCHGHAGLAARLPEAMPVSQLFPLLSA